MLKAFFAFIKSFLVYACVAHVSNASAQNVCKSLYINQSQLDICIDSIPVFANTIKIFSPDTRPYPFSIFYSEQCTWLHIQSDTFPAKLNICWQRIPYPYSSEIHIFDSTSVGILPKYNSNQIHTENFFLPPKQNLKINGVLNRGLGVGNTKDASVQSGTTLNISGEILDSTTLHLQFNQKELNAQSYAATYYANDLNFFSMKLRHKHFALDAGEYDYSDTLIGRLPYQVHSTGVMIGGNLDSANMQYSLTMSTKTGTNRQTSISLIAGNQGPYTFIQEMPGKVFIIVGSIRVLNNGAELSKSLYTVDLVNGTILFSSLFPIFGSELIEIYFKYNDSNLQNWLIGSAANWQIGQTNLGISILRNSETIAGLDFNDMTPAQRLIYQQAGDNNGTNLNLKKVKVEKNTQYGYYLLADTSFLGIQYTVFREVSEYTDSAFVPYFKYIGNKKGNYKQVKSLVNKVIYEWFRPIDGIPQGDYEVASELDLPADYSLYNASAEWLNIKNTATVWISISDMDKNKYSDLNDTDNRASAFGMNYTTQILNYGLWKLLWHTDGNYIHKNYTSPSELFSAEDRKRWNLPLVYQNGSITEANSSLKLISENDRLLEIGGSLLGITDVYQGGAANAKIQWVDDSEKLYLQARGLKARSNAIISSAVFVNMSAEKNLAAHILYLENVLEKIVYDTEIKLHDNSELIKSELGFRKRDTSNIYWDSKLGYHAYQTNDSARANNIQWSFSGNLFLPVAGQGALSSYFMISKIQGNQNIGFLQITRYKQQIIKYIQLSQQIESFIGNEPVQNIRYMNVPKGKGTHVWNDKNGNGIAEINEFEAAYYTDQATHIRVASSSIGDFQQSKNLKLNGNLNFMPPWLGAYGIQMGTSHAYLLTKKIRKEENLFRNLGGLLYADTNGLSNQFYTENAFLLQSRFISIQARSQFTQHYILLPLGAHHLKNNTFNLQFTSFVRTGSALLFDYTHAINLSKFTAAERFFNIKSNTYALTYKYNNEKLNEIDIELKYAQKLEQNTMLRNSTPSAKVAARGGKQDVFNAEISATYAYISLNTNADTYFRYELMEGLSEGSNLILQTQASWYISAHWLATGNLMVRVLEHGKPVYSGNLGIKAILQ